MRARAISVLVLIVACGPAPGGPDDAGSSDAGAIDAHREPLDAGPPIEIDGGCGDEVRATLGGAGATIGLCGAEWRVAPSSMPAGTEIALRRLDGVEPVLPARWARIGDVLELATTSPGRVLCFGDRLRLAYSAPLPRIAALAWLPPGATEWEVRGVCASDDLWVTRDTSPLEGRVALIGDDTDYVPPDAVARRGTASWSFAPTGDEAAPVSAWYDELTVGTRSVHVRSLDSSLRVELDLAGGAARVGLVSVHSWSARDVHAEVLLEDGARLVVDLRTTLARLGSSAPLELHLDVPLLPYRDAPVDCCFLDP